MQMSVRKLQRFVLRLQGFVPGLQKSFCHTLPNETRFASLEQCVYLSLIGETLSLNVSVK